ncbi:MAG: glycosyltransferase family 4 protein [Chitinispirillaceae bacterium]
MIQKRKLCFFCSVSSLSTGMPISTYKLIEGFSRKETYRVCVILPSEGEFQRKLAELPVDLQIIPFSRFRLSPRNFMKFIKTYLKAGWVLCGFFKQNGIEVVHFSDILDIPFFPWARLAGAESIAHVRFNFGNRIVRFLMRKWTLLFCSRIICISRYVMSYYGFKSEKCRVVYNAGPDRSLFSTEKTGPIKDLVPKGKTVVLAIAALRSVKGHHYFLDIARMVKDALGDKVHFVIAGGKLDGHESYYARILQQAQDSGLEKQLVITGNVPHETIPSIIASSDILIHVPAYQEGLGGVVLEAMAMKVPVVAFDSGGVKECFRDGESGFLVPQFDCRAAADRVIDLIRNPELHKATVRNAVRDLDRRFTYERNLGSVQKVYDEVFRNPEKE